MGMFLRRGFFRKLTVILSAPVSHNSTYSMFATVNSEKLTDAATIEFYSGSEVRVTISYSALRSNGKVILNGITVSNEKEGTYEFVATKNTHILFEGHKSYNGDGKTVWKPTCTITEN